jgi:hypothetical protein
MQGSPLITRYSVTIPNHPHPPHRKKKNAPSAFFKQAHKETSQQRTNENEMQENLNAAVACQPPIPYFSPSH